MVFASAAHAQMSPQGVRPPSPTRRVSPGQPPAVPPDWRLVLGNLIGTSYNPPGLENQTRIGFQGRLFHSEHVLLRDAFVFFGTYPKVNPALIKVGPWFELQPLSILNLGFGIELIDYYGTFQLAQSFGSA